MPAETDEGGRDGAPREPIYQLPPGYGPPVVPQPAADPAAGNQVSPEPAARPRGAPRGPWAARTGPEQATLAERLGGPPGSPAPAASPAAGPVTAATPPANGAAAGDPAGAPPPGAAHRSTGRADAARTGPAPARAAVPTLPRPGGEAPERPAPLASDALLRSRRHAAPLTGWRGTIRRLTFGAVQPGPSPAQVRRDEQLAAIRVPITGTHRVAVISLKGGVGKTTTTMMLGSTLASLRGDRVIALDANPDAGTLGDRLPRRTKATVRDLLTHYGEVRSWADLAGYTSQASSRLEVIANDVDPSVSTAVTAADYLRIVEMLGRYYSVVLTDSGTGLLHDAMGGILSAADTLVLVSSASVDGARSASTTLDWLEAQGYGELVRSAVTVVSSVRPGGREVDVDAIADYFASRCRAVVRVPFDPHLETGAETDLDALTPGAREAYLQLAVAVAADFDRGSEDDRARRRGRARVS